jgi:hypothetical protein
MAQAEQKKKWMLYYGPFQQRGKVLTTLVEEQTLRKKRKIVGAKNTALRKQQVLVACLGCILKKWHGNATQQVLASG